VNCSGCAPSANGLDSRERLSLKGAPDRIIHYLETEGELGAMMLTQTKEQWAAELGLTHEALYRTLAQMRDPGAIRIDGRKICFTRVPSRRS
jgi:CRP-like cAMP-binding protein